MTIRKGKHKSFRLPKFYWNKRVFEWSVFFDSSCLYDLNVYGKAINKLCGVGYLWSIHDDSARIGWRCTEDGKIQLLAYCYVDGERQSSEAKEYVLDELTMWCTRKVRIEVVRFAYLFYVNGVLKEVIDKEHDKKLAYRCNPFFGGEKPAPHDMTINLKQLK